MDMSSLSRADLERELLSPPTDGGAARHACDGEACYGTTPVRSDPLARKLCVARELLMRDLRARMQAGPIMDSPQVVRDWLRLYCAGLEHEVFVVLYLTAQHALIEAVRHFSGTLTQTSVYPREVVKGALARNAAAVVFCHNHPSGHAEPSRADEYLTQTLKASLSMVDVRVMDHLIVAGEHAVSMAERGLV